MGSKNITLSKGLLKELNTFFEDSERIKKEDQEKALGQGNSKRIEALNNATDLHPAFKGGSDRGEYIYYVLMNSMPESTTALNGASNLIKNLNCDDIHKITRVENPKVVPKVITNLNNANNLVKKLDHDDIVGIIERVGNKYLPADPESITAFNNATNLLPGLNGSNIRNAFVGMADNKEQVKTIEILNKNAKLFGSAIIKDKISSLVALSPESLQNLCNFIASENKDIFNSDRAGFIKNYIENPQFNALVCAATPARKLNAGDGKEEVAGEPKNNRWQQRTEQENGFSRRPNTGVMLDK